MNFFELIETRQSGRSYDGQPLERELLTQILKAGVIAPSACNSQPWRFIAVDEPTTAKEVATLTQKEGLPINRFTNNCPAFIIICETKAVLMSADMDSQKYAQLDLGIATAHMALAATTLGVENCILGLFDEAGLKKLCNIPEDFKIRLVLALGHGSSELRPKPRKEFSEITHFNHWE